MLTLQSLIYNMDKANTFADIIHAPKYGIFLPETGWTYSSTEFLTKLIIAYSPEAVAKILYSHCKRKTDTCDKSGADLKIFAIFDITYRLEDTVYGFDITVAQFI